MRMPARLQACMPLLVWLAFFSFDAQAQVNSAGLFDDVLSRYNSAASSWAGVITDAATWLFWTLVAISMVWTFGMLALRKADIGDFFAEFVRFTLFTGFFWWLLINGPNFASSIYASLRKIAGDATGLGNALSPSGVVDVGFAIFYRVMDQSSVWTPADSMTGILMAVAIMVILALVGVNMLLLLAAGWVLAYGGVFFLGFGGSRWTSDMAISYYKTVLGVAAQLMAMVLVVGIGKTFLDDYYARMSAGINLKQMGVMLIVCIILLALVNRIPSLISGVITGASLGHSGVGNFGAGAAVGAAGMAAAAAATGGAMLAASAANAGGGAQALMAAFAKASENVQSGSDVLSSMWGGRSGGDGDRREESTWNTPFAQAAGFASSVGDSGANAVWQGGSSGSAHKGQFDRGPDKSGTARDSTRSGSARNAETSQQRSSGGLMSTVGKAGLITADAAANLAKATAQVAKDAITSTRDAATDRIADTTGGRIAATINAGSAPEGSGVTDESVPMFEGNRLAGADPSDVDAATEIAAFVNREARFG